MLDACVLSYGAGVGQAHIQTRVHQAIDQPVPVVGRFHDAGQQFALEWLKYLSYDLKIIRMAFLVMHNIVIINHRDQIVVCMKVNSAIKCHGHLLFQVIHCCLHFNEYHLI